MKKDFIKISCLLFFLLNIISLQSQEYTLSKLSSECTYPEKEYDSDVTCSIFLIKNANDTIREFKIEPPADSDFDQRIIIKDISGFGKYKEVINIEFSYTGCCSSIYDNYTLMGDDGNYENLAELYNVHCDGPEPELDYIFPNEKFGQEQVILKAIKKYIDFDIIDSIEIVAILLATKQGIFEKQ